MIKLLIGGSPCTYWSIAQKNNRETEPSGMGWELFKNYLIAKEKFKPDFFLYENNKSADEAIKRQIREELNVWDGTFLMEDTGVRYIEINSALVSAQNRQRFYVHNCGDVGQPEDRGILLRDILESGQGWTEKSYAMTASYDGAVAWNTLERKQRTMVAEPICVQEQVFGRQANDNGEYDRRYEARTDGKSGSLTGTNRQNAVAEPVIFQTPRGNNAGGCKYEKSPTMTANASWQDNNRVIEPVNITVDGKAKALRASADKDGLRNLIGNERDKRTCVAEPVRVGTYPSEAKNKESKQYRIYDVKGKSTTLCGEGGDMGAKTGLYAIPKYLNDKNMEHLMRPFGAKGKIVSEDTDKSSTVLAAAGAGGGNAIYYAERTDGKTYPVYEVRNGLITIKDKQYPIKLADGFYIIRKLTVTECCRLQTLPDDYCRAVSASQAYKGLGNGWTAEVIIHILSNALKDVPRDEKIIVLSMYDGIATGRYCLDKIGFTNVEYHAYEIDKYAMKIAMSNYPDIIQHGDAFAVRNEDWKL